jgi:osmoprotectant transport system substrate-binding protein
MTRTTALALALVTGLALSACGGGDDPLDTADGNGADSTGSDDTGATGDAGAGGGAGSITVGSANFPGNVVLAEMYAAVLSDAGVDVDTRLNIGNRETYIGGIQDGSIDLIPEYTGALTLYLTGDQEAGDPEAVYEALQGALPESLTVLEPSDAEDKDAVVVTRETAEEYGLTSIADLEPVAGELVLGGPPEWEERFSGVPGLREVYGLEFSAFRPLAAGSNLTAQSLVNGQIDAANIFTTDPAIPENDFVVLEDPENLFVAQNVVPLIREDAVNDTVTEALNEFSASLTTEDLTAALSQVVVDGEDPADVAREYVDSL